MPRRRQRDTGCAQPAIARRATNDEHPILDSSQPAPAWPAQQRHCPWTAGISVKIFWRHPHDGSFSRAPLASLPAALQPPCRLPRRPAPRPSTRSSTRSTRRTTSTRKRCILLHSLPSLRAELLRSRRFLTKETAAMHTMHEARAPLAPAAADCRCAVSLGCSLTHCVQIVKHFGSTEQGIKNYMHRHVRACVRWLWNCADAARCAGAGNHGDQGVRFVLAPP